MWGPSRDSLTNSFNMTRRTVKRAVDKSNPTLQVQSSNELMSSLIDRNRTTKRAADKPTLQNPSSKGSLSSILDYIKSIQR